MFVVLRFGKPFFAMCQCTLSPLSLFILVGGLCPLAAALRNPLRKPGAVQGGSGCFVMLLTEKGLCLKLKSPVATVQLFCPLKQQVLVMDGKRRAD